MNASEASSFVVYPDRVDGKGFMWEQLDECIRNANDKGAFKILCTLHDDEFPKTWGFDMMVNHNMIKSIYVYYLRSSCSKLDLFRAMCMSRNPKIVHAACCIIEHCSDTIRHLKSAILMQNSLIVRKVLTRGKARVDCRVLAHVAAQADSATCLEIVLRFSPRTIRIDAAAFAQVTIVGMSKGHLLPTIVRVGINPVNNEALLNARAVMKQLGLPVLDRSERFYVARSKQFYHHFV